MRPEQNALDAMRDAAAAVDPQGRIPPPWAGPARKAVETLVQSVPDQPTELFGPWESLPSGAQGNLRRLLEADLAACGRLYPHGAGWTGFVRGLRQLDRHLADQRRGGRFRPLIVASAERFHDGPLHAWRLLAARRRRARWLGARRPFLADSLAALGVDPRWLMGGFVRRVRQPHGARTFFDDPQTNVAHGFHLGIDLMPTPRGICYLEGNLRSGLNANRPELVGEEPLARTAVATARAHRASSLIWVEAQRYPLHDWAVRDLGDQARAAGLRLEILEDPCMPPPRGRANQARVTGHYRALDDLPRDTLVLRRSEMLGGPDHMIVNKEPSIRALAGVLASKPDRGLFVLPMTREPRLPDDPTPPGLPNLVYKYPDSSSGRGVFFMRARDAAHAVAMARRLDTERNEPPGLFQPFECPTLDDRRRVHDVRAEIFVTPRETRFVIALRREASRPVPHDLDFGLVEEKGIFTSNISTGGALLPVPDHELPAIRRAAVAAGDALRAALASTFVVRAEHKTGRE